MVNFHKCILITNPIFPWHVHLFKENSAARQLDSWSNSKLSKLPCCSCVYNLVNLSCTMEVSKTLKICEPIYSSSWTSKIKRLKAIKESKICSFKSIMRFWKSPVFVLRSHMWSWLFTSCEWVMGWRVHICM